MRISFNKINEQVQRINEWLNIDEELHLTLDHNAAGFRVGQKSRDISPRLSPTRMLEWLDAFKSGIEFTLDRSFETSKKRKKVA